MVRVIAAGSEAAVELAVDALGSGLLVGIPTETVYGVCSLPTYEAVERLIGAKRRSTEKGIQLLVDSLEQVRGLAVVTRAAEQVAQRFWPGALTIVLDRRTDV